MVKFTSAAIVMLLFSMPIHAHARYPDPVGSYVSEDSLRVLILEEDGSYVLRSTTVSERRRIPSKIYTPENWKLSYGSWRQEGSFVVLNVSDEIVGYFLEMQLVQKTTESDSVSFTFESPCIEDTFCQSQYLCEIWITGSGFTRHPFDCESFIISKEEVPYLPQFRIIITPQSLRLHPYAIQYNYLASSSWGGVRFESNEFVVRLDKFTPEYIYYIRFLNEYMPVDESGIYVRGVRYTKRAE